jgi:hypothetical protein
MSETYTEQWKPEFAPEKAASIDTLIWQGEFKEAQETIEYELALLAEQGASRDASHQLRLKLVSLPLYDLAINGATPERVDRALDVYGELAELLAEEISHLKSLPGRYTGRASKKERVECIGRISEIVMPCLLARDLREDAALVLLPADAEDDLYGRSRATDYYLTLVKGKGEAVMYPTQLKSKVTDTHQAQYDTSVINVIGLNEIDPHYYGKQSAAGSLSSAMFRELSGNPHPSDKHQLDTAALIFLSRIHAQSSDGLVRHSTKEGWLTL